jgi:hypothetical protein
LVVVVEVMATPLALLVVRAAVARGQAQELLLAVLAHLGKEMLVALGRAQGQVTALVAVAVRVLLVQTALGLLAAQAARVRLHPSLARQ